MHIPSLIYEYLPETYTVTATVSMLVSSELLVVALGLLLTLAGLMTWRARKNNRFAFNRNAKTVKQKREKHHAFNRVYGLKQGKV